MSTDFKDKRRAKIAAAVRKDVILDGNVPSGVALSRARADGIVIDAAVEYHGKAGRWVNVHVGGGVVTLALAEVAAILKGGDGAAV